MRGRPHSCVDVDLCAGHSALPAARPAADRIWLAGIALSVYKQAPPVGGHGRPRVTRDETNSDAGVQTEPRVLRIFNEDRKLYLWHQGLVEQRCHLIKTNLRQTSASTWASLKLKGKEYVYKKTLS
jgi:hypothetical protein